MVSIVLLTFLLSLLLVSPVAGEDEPTPTPPPPRTISVTKYYDIDGDGRLDPEDGPKDGWLIRVYYYDGTDWILFAEGNTGADGSVTFTNLPESKDPRLDWYLVWEEARDCWRPTRPDVTYWEEEDGYIVPLEVPAGATRWVGFKNTYECGGDGCTLTPGYWKTHSIYGPAPYDDTWAAIGEDTPFFNSGKSWYEALWTQPKGGEAYFILAHAYIAAALNFENGTDPADAQEAFDDATELFMMYDDSIPKSDPNREIAIGLAEILDNYNNGIIGPGHCAE